MTIKWINAASVYNDEIGRRCESNIISIVDDGLTNGASKALMSKPTVD